MRSCLVGFKNSGWITSHGMALNVTDEPLAYFGHIIPCGDPLGRVTSLSAELRSIGSGTSGGDMGREISPRDGRSPHPPTEGHPFLMRRMEALLLEAFSDTFHCDWFQDQGC